jgi:hypothetical protein
MARRSSLGSAVALVLTVVLTQPVGAQVVAPAGQIIFANTVTLAPTWFDPAETPGVITPFLMLYMYERAMFAPIVEQAALTGVGPRLADVPTITGHPFISPYEELRLK